MRPLAIWVAMIGGFAYILTGLNFIELARTTIIDDMTSYDWMLTISGTVIVFSGLFIIMATVSFSRK
jgi:hypothetical protein|tara:strand:- start:46 stop:246 length:201 start_codon:yes stop_codon:yes gene_type:complete